MNNKIVLHVSDNSKFAYYSDFLRAIVFGLDVLPCDNETNYPEITIDYLIECDGTLVVAVCADRFTPEPICCRMLFTQDDLEIYDPQSNESATIKAVKLVLISALTQALGRAFSWGTLTGVRPTKVVDKLLARGYDPDDIINLLLRLYRLDAKKANMITELSLLAAEHRPENIETAAIYVAIPYCPSKCNYCSFTSYVMKKGSVEQYMDTLLNEIDVISPSIRRFAINAIYVGGGTPAVLQPIQITMLFDRLRSRFNIAEDCEITFEAGRSDLITEELLAACAGAGVKRVSVNPQTIHEKTLRYIARPGGREEINRAVEMVRAAGIPVLNMDLIAGLPGESVNDYRESLEYIMEKKPENITIHALALKRASKFVSESMQIDCPGEDDVSEMFDLTSQMLAVAGYMPYYMYRQKHMPGDQENMGYCLKGYESIYNINMIEDWQTIIGLGAGSATKLLSRDGRISRIYNPKEPKMYMNELIERMDAKCRLFSGDNERR